MNSDQANFARMLQESTDAQLEVTGRDYIWLAEFGPEPGRRTFELRRDAFVFECERLGRADIVQQIRERLSIPRVE